MFLLYATEEYMTNGDFLRAVTTTYLINNAQQLLFSF